MAYDSDDGFWHLTPNGWVRKDEEPFPSDRLETWHYSMSQASGWSQEHRSWTCTWASPDHSRADRDMLRIQHPIPDQKLKHERGFVVSIRRPL